MCRYYCLFQVASNYRVENASIERDFTLTQLSDVVDCDTVCRQMLWFVSMDNSITFNLYCREMHCVCEVIKVILMKFKVCGFSRFWLPGRGQNVTNHDPMGGSFRFASIFHPT